MEDLLDGDVATLLRPANKSGLEDDAKGSITDDFAICVGNVFLVTGLAIGGDHFNDLVWVMLRVNARQTSECVR